MFYILHKKLYEQLFFLSFSLTFAHIVVCIGMYMNVCMYVCMYLNCISFFFTGRESQNRLNFYSTSEISSR